MSARARPFRRRAIARAGLVVAVVVAGLAVAAAEVPPERRQLNLDTFDRAWSIVDEGYWDPTFHGVDWNALREELRPRAAAAADDGRLRDVLEDMVSRLGQSHFGIIPGSVSRQAAGEASGDDELPSCAGNLSELVLAVLRSDAPPMTGAGPGIAVELADGAVLVERVDPGGPAAAAGIETGWELLRVDGQPLADVGACLGADLDERALRSLVFRLVASLLEGDAGSSVELDLRDRAGAERTLRLRRELAADVETVQFGNLPPVHFRFAARRVTDEGGLDVGVIRFNYWMMPVAAAFEDAVLSMRDADGIVLDLRGNPGGVAGLSGGIAGYFVPTAEVLGTLRYRSGELRLPVNPRFVSRHGEAIDPYDGPLAILIDQFSASTSEIFAAGLQDLGRARVFGEASAAAALPAVVEELPNGDFLMHPMADLERPGGGRIEGVGVEPDVLAPATRAGLLRGGDEALEAALEWISERSRAAGTR
ncbi:MAG TPA: S41 family peptidase [Thermoanaerobaculia bacterium]|nr:S41 family peptidase [Thermoanaerobaculia bacterium]